MSFWKRKASPPAPNWTGPCSFFDWNDEDLARVSQAIRKNGQPESADFRVGARVALNTLRGGSAVELVARAMEESANPGRDPDRPIEGSHYMHGMPHWCMWVEYARPAVELIATAIKQSHFKCKARRGADPPEDCNWPFCGCDPYANKVIEAIEETTGDALSGVRGARLRAPPAMVQRDPKQHEPFLRKLADDDGA